VIHTSLPGVDLYEEGCISGVGNGTEQYYPSGDPIQLDPPYAKAGDGDCEYYVGGSTEISLGGLIYIDDGKDKGWHDLTGCPTEESNAQPPGMPIWWVSEPYINLWLADKPVGYTTSLGEKLDFSIQYKQRDTRPRIINGQDAFVPITGWNHNWFSYIHFTGDGQDFNSWTATLYERSGGETEFTSDQPSDPNTGDQLLPMDGINSHVYPLDGRTNVYGTIGFRLVHPDGSQDIYGKVSALYPTNITETVPVLLNPGNTNNQFVQGPFGTGPKASTVPQYFYSPIEVGIYTNGGGAIGGGGLRTNSFIPLQGSSVFAGYFTNGTVDYTAPPSADAVLTEHIDPYGNAVHLSYIETNGQLRLQYIVDYDGNITQITYDTNGLLSRVDMPYGRTASFQFMLATTNAPNTNAELYSVTDAQGMTSAFSYGNDGYPASMTTPYGTNLFDYFEADQGSVAKYSDGVSRAIKITNPDGSQEIYAFCNRDTNSAPTNYSGSQVPSSSAFGTLDNGSSGNEQAAMYRRNSFYWGRKQCEALSTTDVNALNSLTPADFALGRLSHWLLESDGVNLSAAISITREPAPDNFTQGQLTWYDYPDKPQNWQVGSDENTHFVTRLQPDGTQWYQERDYNSFAQPNQVSTTYTGPDGNTDVRYDYFAYETLNYSQACSVNQINMGSSSWTASGLAWVEFWSSYDYIPLFSLDHPAGTVTTVDTYTTNSDGSVSALTTTRPDWSRIDISDALSNTKSIFFNTRQQVTGTKLPTGLTTTNFYGPDGILSQSIAFETHATNTYNFTNGLLAAKTDALGLGTYYVWDNLERLIGISYPDNTSISNVYTRLDLTGQKDRLGNWTHAQYNELRQMTSFTDRNNNTTHLTYCQCGGLESITDPQTNTTTYNRNLVGWVTSILFADSAGANETLRIFALDSLGRATNVTDSTGINLNYKYNLQGLVTNVTSSQGVVFAASYNDFDKPLTIQNAEGVTVNNTYDDLERITDQNYPEGIAQHYVYNGLVLDYTTDGLNHHTAYGYDPAGRITSIIDANNITNQFTYNPKNEILTLKDGKVHVTSWTYDLYGRNISKTDANNVLVETNGYDANGRLTAHWTPAKGLTQYTYDNNGNPQTITYSSGPNITATFDSLNRITSMSDAVGASAFTYRNFGAFMSALATEGGFWPNDTVHYTYTNRLRTGLTLNSQPSALNISYGYDSLLRLHTVTSPAGTFTYTYNGAGKQIQNLSLPGSSSITNAYDDAGQLLTTALKDHLNNILDSYGYAYNANGNRTSVQRADNSHVAFGYDPIGQLTSAVGAEANNNLRGNENFGYQYDAAGNLAMRTNNTLIQTFTNGNANQLVNISRNNLLTVGGSLTSQPNNLAINGQTATLYNDLTFAATNGVAINDGANTFTAVVTAASSLMTNSMTKTLPASVTFACDLNGNMTGDGLHGYDYDCANELTRITVTNSWKTEYVYDGFGRRRIRKEFVWQNSQWLTANEVRYIYDGMLVIQERNAINVPMVTYTRGSDLSGTMQGAGGIGGLLARTDANGSAFYHADGNGNITMMTDASGNQVAKYLYDSFGNSLGMWGTLAAVNTYRFSSKEFDLRSGLYCYGFRFYDPNLQRWPNHDPIQERGGLNLYGYVGNNPLDYVDTDGRAPQMVGFTYDPNSGAVNPQYVDQQFGQDYGIGLHNPLGPDGVFFFAGGELPAPGGAGLAMDYEGATFVGYNKNTGFSFGSFNCVTTKGIGRLGAGQESYFSSRGGTHVEPIKIGDFHVPTPGLNGGIGDIGTPTGNSLYFYLQAGGNSRLSGFFVGFGIDVNKIMN
jgi:RHS repeat-associated protein